MFGNVEGAGFSSLLGTEWKSLVPTPFSSGSSMESAQLAEYSARTYPPGKVARTEGRTSHHSLAFIGSP